METFYPALTEEQWEDILSADVSHDYQLHPTETAPRDGQDLPQDSPADLPSDASNPENISLPDANPAAYLFDN